jgi:hypothetical protein
MVYPSATSKAEARWLRFGLVVVATTSRRDNKDQMIRPLLLLSLLTSASTERVLASVGMMTPILLREQ